MGVYRRPDSVFWWATYEGTGTRESLKIPVEGGSPRQNAELRRQAQAIYAVRMGQIIAGKHGLTDLPRRTFLEHRTWYAEHVSAHKRGVVREESMLRQLGAFFDGYDLGDITVRLVREWRTWRRGRGVRASTIMREEEILKHMLREAMPTYLTEHPLDGLARMRVEDVAMRILTPDEERRLLAAAKRPIDRALVLCGLDALLRRGSVLGLTREQAQGASLTLLNAKAGTYRVPVSARLRKALDAVPEAGRPLYFPFTVKAFDERFTALVAAAKIPHGRAAGGITFHCLRHTGASRMLAAGVDIKTVMLVGGWHNLAVLQRYLHPTEDHQRAAVEAIGGRRTNHV